ncbi:TIGR04104 family putative zinc finger protein [Oceanobacillus bengalensis]|uniref:Cxxc_20_cxxc protein n=1 Tax=Oceanobacillus bengalensis TaxID=1435466 RepID=A0A494Z2S6_9BACI|nr:hypothetical protein D8M05_06120 [Oceanobacillus bengalensis]
MQKCKKCHRQFKWSELYLLPKWKDSNEPVYCTNCKTEHYLTNTSNFIQLLLVCLTVAVTIYISYFVFSVNLILSCLISFIFTLPLSLLFPFFSNYYSR